MAEEGKGPASDEIVVPTTCDHDCGGRCVLKLHVRNGVITRIETDDGNDPQLRACARGRAYRQRAYAPDRLKYPMKRVGERGEGKFERISWDEALDKIASEMKRIREAHGPGAFVNLQYSGELYLQGVAVGRLLNMFGGNLQHWGGGSAEGNAWAIRATYGPRPTAMPVVDPFRSRLIIMWGWNPANNLYGSLTNYHLSLAKEKGTKIICVDPRYTDTAAVFADEWVPISPGTDAGMLVAMAYVMIRGNLQDQKFLDTHTVGFDKFKEYVLGMEDGVAKTPAWAEPITGVPAATIERLAKEYATTKPAALVTAWGPGRTAYGEQYHRAAHAVAAITGNNVFWGNLVASQGVGATTGALPNWLGLLSDTVNSRGNFNKGKNPFDSLPGAPKKISDGLDPALKNRRRVLQGKLYDAILEGKKGGYPSDIKMVWVNCGNTLNQLPNTNKGAQAFRKLEFIVVSEQFMTSTARFADILLPVKTHLERNTIIAPWSGGAYLFHANKAIEPIGESKSDFEICAELAPRLGIDNYSDKTEEEWLRDDMSGAEMRKLVPDYDAFRQRGIWKIPVVDSGPIPPQPTIHIYSQEVADLNDPRIPPIPKYIEPWEGRNDPLAKKYPLQLITSHPRLRAHSVFDNVPWLKQLEPQRVWINTADAETRGIRNGDEVQIFNDRGCVFVPAYVTERIMPGVVNLSEGASYKPDSEGVDRGGCPNVLTSGEHSPAGAWTTHTNLVQVAKV